MARRAVVGKASWAEPDLLQRFVPEVSFDERFRFAGARLQRQASLDAAIALDPDRLTVSVTARPMTLIEMIATEVRNQSLCRRLASPS